MTWEKSKLQNADNERGEFYRKNRAPQGSAARQSRKNQLNS